MVFPPSTPEGTREHIARCIGWAAEQPRSFYDLAVERKGEDRVIGGAAIAINDRERGEASFSYLYNHAY